MRLVLPNIPSWGCGLTYYRWAVWLPPMCKTLSEKGYDKSNLV